MTIEEIFALPKGSVVTRGIKNEVFIVDNPPKQVVNDNSYNFADLNDWYSWVRTNHERLSPVTDPVVLDQLQIHGAKTFPPCHCGGRY